MVVGGEWFAMWQSEDWNGQDPAFRFFTMIEIVLVVLLLPEQEARDYRRKQPPFRRDRDRAHGADRGAPVASPLPDVRIAWPPPASAGSATADRQHAPRDRRRRVDPLDRPRREPARSVRSGRDSACRRARSCRSARRPASMKAGPISARIAASSTGSPRM